LPISRFGKVLVTHLFESQPLPKCDTDRDHNRSEATPNFLDISNFEETLQTSWNFDNFIDLPEQHHILWLSVLLLCVPRVHYGQTVWIADITGAKRLTSPRDPWALLGLTQPWRRLVAWKPKQPQGQQRRLSGKHQRQAYSYDPNQL